MNGTDKWEIHIGRPLDCLGADVTIFRALIGQRKYEVMHANSDGYISVEIIEASASVKPTLRLDNEGTLRELIAAFAKEGKALGVKAPDESHNAGKLEATEKHLKDMRAIVFEKPVIEGQPMPEGMWKGKHLSELSKEEWEDFAKNVQPYAS